MNDNSPSTPSTATTSIWIKAVAGIALLMVVLIGNVIVTHNVFTEPVPGMNDFMSRWEGARSFFEDGVSPYSETATLNIQNRIYGRPVIENEDPGLFVYPFYTVFAVFPTVYMDYSWASAVWMVLLEVCLIASLILLLNLYGWKPALWVLPFLFLWALMDYFASRGLFLGQPSHIVYFLQVLTLWALFRKQDAIAGSALAMSTLKPQMGYLIVPFLLLWALREKRWHFIGWFAGVFAVLMGASFLLQPDWFGDWIQQVRDYPQYTAAAYPDTGSPVWIVVQHYLGLGSVVEWVVNIVILASLLWAWHSVLVQRREDRFLWAVVLTLIVTHLIALRTATPHFAVFNIALIFYFKNMNQRAALGTILTFFLFFWALFFITVQGRDSLEHPILFLPLPFALYLITLMTRRMWWKWEYSS